MKIDEESVDMLSKFGLNKYEINAYTALVSAGRLTATEISAASGIPGARVYDIMDSLEKKGFVLIGLGRPTQYQAVEPKEALEDYKERTSRNYKRELERFDENKKTLLSVLNPLWEKDLTFKKPHEVFSVREDEDIPVMIDKMLRRAKAEVWMLGDNYLFSFLTERHMHSLEDASHRGIKLRFITPLKIEKDMLSPLRSLGEMKTVAEPPCSFFLVDKKSLLLIQGFNEFEKELRAIALWTTSSLISKMFIWIFDQIWSEAKTSKGE